MKQKRCRKLDGLQSLGFMAWSDLSSSFIVRDAGRPTGKNQVELRTYTKSGNLFKNGDRLKCH